MGQGHSDHYAVIVDDTVRAIFKEIAEAREYAEMVGGTVLGWRIPAKIFKFEDEE